MRKKTVVSMCLIFTLMAAPVPVWSVEFPEDDTWAQDEFWMDEGNEGYVDDESGMFEADDSILEPVEEDFLFEDVTNSGQTGDDVMVSESFGETDEINEEMFMDEDQKRRDEGLIAEGGEVLFSGECGKEEGTLFWEIDDSGILCIFGEGEMKDWESADAVPWNEHTDFISSIEVLDGVSTIGSFAFSNCAGVIEAAIG